MSRALTMLGQFTQNPANADTCNIACKRVGGYDCTDDYKASLPSGDIPPDAAYTFLDGTTLLVTFNTASGLTEHLRAIGPDECRQMYMLPALEPKPRRLGPTRSAYCGND